MAFKGYNAAGITTEAVVHTGPASTETVVIGMSIATTGINPAVVSVKRGTVYMVKDAPIPVGGAMVVIGGDQKVALEAATTISVSSDEPVDVLISVLETAV